MFALPIARSKKIGSVRQHMVPVGGVERGSKKSSSVPAQDAEQSVRLKDEGQALHVFVTHESVCVRRHERVDEGKGGGKTKGGIRFYPSSCQTQWALKQLNERYLRRRESCRDDFL